MTLSIYYKIIVFFLLIRKDRAREKTRIPLKRFFGIPTGFEAVENPIKSLFRDSHLSLASLFSRNS